MEHSDHGESAPFPISQSAMAWNQQWVERNGAGLFPSTCSLAVQRYDTSDIVLPPADDPALDHAVEKRRREFSAGRSAARAALLKLGWAETRVPVGTDRNPLWPADIVGSITHTAGLAVAVVARNYAVRAVGLDLELREAVNQPLWRSILTPHETDYVSAKPPDQQACTATLIFSAKESFYKMQFPLTARWVDFQEAEVTISEAAGEFELTCSQTPVIDRLKKRKFSGRYATGPDFTLTAMHLATT